MEFSKVFGARSENPSTVDEFQFYQGLNEDEQDVYMAIKRASRVVDLGDRSVVLDPTNPEVPAAIFTEGLSPSDQPANIAAAEATKTGTPQVLTPAQRSADTVFGADYASYVAQGGYADIIKQLDQIQAVAKTLGGDQNLTGPVVGRIPDFINAFFNPQSIEVREDFEEVVQRNLRLILGPQFTEKEGERLISRAYNPALSEETNKMRVERLFLQMGTAAQAKQEAIQYYEQNGTLQGFEGKLPTFSDFNVIDDESDVDSILRNAGIID
jgi:hypothetical protein